LRVILDHSDAETDNIRTFYFQPEKPLRYTAGQYIELTLGGFAPDDLGRSRWFTLSSSPTQPLLSITTKFTPEEPSTFKKALLAMQPGDAGHMTGPLGDFVLPKDASIPLLFVAGGIGITPIHSMLQWLVDSDEKRMIQCMYGVSRESEIIFQVTLNAAEVHTTIVVANPFDAWGGERGRLSAEMIVGVKNVTPDTLIYLSGPEPMVDQLYNDLQHHGINRQQLVRDAFPGYSKNY